MASSQEILARMRKSFVCPTAFGHSLESLRQRKMDTVIKGKEYMRDDGMLKSYIIYDDRPEAPYRQGKCAVTRAFREGKLVKSASLVCKVIAKEFVLRHQKVVCYSDTDLVNFAKYQTEVELGSGYIVVPGLDEECTAYSHNDWEEAQSLLLSHFWRGGGLILGDEGALANGLLSWRVVRALHRFEFIEVE